MLRHTISTEGSIFLREWHDINKRLAKLKVENIQMKCYLE